VTSDRGRDGGALIEVPAPDVPVEQILRFAASYNAYEVFAQEPTELERISYPIYDDIARSGRVPEWVRVDLARAVLFYAYRSDYFSGGYGPYEPMRTLVGRICQLSGGWVERRDRGLSPTPSASPVGRVGSGFVDTSEYSDDHVYRWWYERRWASGPSLCFVGLNPATGDTDGKPRRTLARVVGWARREDCAAVVVVNLFAYRTTKPAALLHSAVDIIGDRNDDVIRERSAAAAITLVAWGSYILAAPRAAVVLPMLERPVCVGVTKSGAPAHPLYIPAATRLRPYP
jgi:hypothetical protein